MTSLFLFQNSEPSSNDTVITPPRCVHGNSIGSRPVKFSPTIIARYYHHAAYRIKAQALFENVQIVVFNLIQYLFSVVFRRFGVSRNCFVNRSNTLPYMVYFLFFLIWRSYHDDVPTVYLYMS